jgi:hypothetical protein
MLTDKIDDNSDIVPLGVVLSLVENLQVSQFSKQ